MTDSDRFQSIIRTAIEKVGTEWWEDSADARFWNETDLQCRLVCCLCETEDFIVQASDPHCGGKTFEVPLVHAECLGAKSRGGLQGAFDVVVFAPSSVRKMVATLRWEDTWQEKLRQEPVLAAIEPKDEKGEWWNNNIERDLRKLVQRMKTDQIEHGYMAIFFDSEKHPLALSDVKKKIEETCGDMPRPNIRVYFFPWSRRQATQEHVDLETL